jgi:hypothetical protein
VAHIFTKSEKLDFQNEKIEKTFSWVEFQEKNLFLIEIGSLVHTVARAK